MEHFFEYHDSRLDFPWLQEDVAPPVKASAFVSCTQDKLNEDQVPQSSNNNMNINKRMREFLMKTTMARSTSTSLLEANDYMERERNRRHMLSERMRREKQRQSYMRLHSLLPSGTKMDKNSIILTAAKKVKELKKYREELERKQSEMNKLMLMVKESGSNGKENLSSSSDEMEEAKIRINVAHPSAAIDSMLEVLKCLKQNNSSNVTLIQSKFMPHQFSAILGIQTKIGAAEVEKAVHRTLFEVEKKFRFNRVEPSYYNT